MTGAGSGTGAGTGSGTGYRVAWRVLRVVRSVLLTTTAVLGAASIGAVVAGLVLDVRPLVVVSGSMEPGMPVGSLIAGRTVPADQVEVGDVVTVPRREGTTDLVTHRVVEVRTPDGADPGVRELVLRGDANETDDPMPYVVAEARRHVATVPGGGYVVRTLQSGRGVVVVGGVLVAAVVLTFAVPSADPATGGRGRRGAGRSAGTPGPAAGDTPREPAAAPPCPRGRHRATATRG